MALVAEGSDGDDALYGGELTSYLDGGAGNDVLWGGLGADNPPPLADAAISCGAGDDTLIEDDVDELPDDCELSEPPYLDGEPQITGDARVGGVLMVSPPRNIGGNGVATIQWERCDASGNACAIIADANGSTCSPTRSSEGKPMRVRYGVKNALGEDWAESQPTAIVAAALPMPPTPRPPRPTTTRPPRPMPTPYLLIPPLAVTRKPNFAIRNGDPVVDTGRTMTCPGVFGGPACRLKVAAVPTLATAHVHRRPSSLGKGSDLVAATAAHARVRVPLNLRAYRLLRAKRKLTLLVTVTVTRPYSATMQSTFTITVKLPKRR